MPLRSATLLSCVPLDGSEPDAKVETLSLERTLHVCLDADQGAITRTVAPRQQAQLYSSLISGRPQASKLGFCCIEGLFICRSRNAAQIQEAGVRDNSQCHSKICNVEGHLVASLSETPGLVKLRCSALPTGCLLQGGHPFHAFCVSCSKARP